MKLTATRATTAVAAFATAGVSGVFLASPAHASPEACGPVGTVVAPGICEQIYTSGSDSFTTAPEMTKLEVLLVGAGGAGAGAADSSNGYSAAGGGGGFEFVDFSGTTNPLSLTVATASTTGEVSDTVITQTVTNGADGVIDDDGDTATGGQSGTGELGTAGGSLAETRFAGGGGAGGGGALESGGDGFIVGDEAPAGSLFEGDTRCFGGGGAAGGVDSIGTPGCGGGGPTDSTATALFAPIANSGGGGGSLTIAQPLELRGGADGIVIIRWTAADVTLAFDMLGHGTAPASQSLTAGTAPTQPAAPVADGFEFKGWFTDAALTAPADFTAPLDSSAVFYASWERVLVPTGGELTALPIGLTALLAGAGALIVARRRGATE